MNIISSTFVLSALTTPYLKLQLILIMIGKSRTIRIKTVVVVSIVYQ